MPIANRRQQESAGNHGARTVTVALIGHCGPDSWMLKGVVERAVPGVRVEMVHDEAGAATAAAACDLLLVNREMDGDFNDRSGVSLIAGLAGDRSRRATMMLVSNYADAQEAARKAGAMPGFGKATAGKPETAEKIRAAVERADNSGCAAG